MTASEALKETIYRDYHAKVLRYLRSKTGSLNTAEDLAADVFVKVFAKLDSFDSTKASLSTWIYTITRNTLTDHFRTRRVYEELPETLEDTNSVEDDVCSEEMLETLAAALETLDERERDILILRYYSGKTLKQIASQMDISYAYVKVLQNKALEKLRKIIGNR